MRKILLESMWCRPWYLKCLVFCVAQKHVYHATVRLYHFGRRFIDGILPKGPYPPCLCMTDRALWAGYPRYQLSRFAHTTQAMLVADSLLTGYAWQCQFAAALCYTSQLSHRGYPEKGPYLPCVSMAVGALLAGYHRHGAKHIKGWMKWSTFCK